MDAFIDIEKIKVDIYRIAQPIETTGDIPHDWQAIVEITVFVFLYYNFSNSILVLSISNILKLKILWEKHEKVTIKPCCSVADIDVNNNIAAM